MNKSLFSDSSQENFGTFGKQTKSNFNGRKSEQFQKKKIYESSSKSPFLSISPKNKLLEGSNIPNLSNKRQITPKLSNLNAKNLPEKIPTENPHPEKMKTIHFLNRIRLIVKAVNVLRFRSSRRNLKGVKENQIEWIGDETFFQQKKPKLYFLKRYTETNVSFYFC